MQDNHTTRIKKKLPDRPAISGLSDRLMRSAYGDMSDLERQLGAYGHVAIGSEMEYYLMPGNGPVEGIDIAALKEQKRTEALENTKNALRELGIPEEKIEEKLSEVAGFSSFNTALDEAKKPLRELVTIAGEIWYDQLIAFLKKKSVEMGTDSAELQALEKVANSPLAQMNYISMGVQMIEAMVDTAKDTGSFPRISEDMEKKFDQIRAFVSDIKVGSLKEWAAPHKEKIAEALRNHGQQQADMPATLREQQYKMMQRYPKEHGMKPPTKEETEAYSKNFAELAKSELGLKLFDEFIDVVEHYAIANKPRLLKLIDDTHSVVHTLSSNSVEAKAEKIVKEFVQVPEDLPERKAYWADRIAAQRKAEKSQRTQIEAGEAAETNAIPVGIPLAVGDDYQPRTREDFIDSKRALITNALRPLQQLGNSFEQELAIEGIKNGLAENGIPLDKSHYEAGIVINYDPTKFGKNGRQHETSISHEDPSGRLLKPHEAMKRLRYGRFQVIEKSKRVGIDVDFSPLPTGMESSSGMHVHFDLRDKNDSKGLLNAITANDGTIQPNTMTDYIERGEIAVMGQAMYSVAPSEKAFMRYRANPFAPNSVCARGTEKQHNAFRRIQIGSTQHLECRLPSSDAEPYFVGATLLGGMLHGLQSMTLDTKFPVPITKKLVKMLQKEYIRLGDIAEDFKLKVHEVGSQVITGYQQEATIQESEITKEKPVINMNVFVHRLRKEGLNVDQRFVDSYVSNHSLQEHEAVSFDTMKEFIDAYAEHVKAYATSHATPMSAEKFAVMLQQEGVEASIEFLGHIKTGILKPGSLLQLDKQAGIPIPQNLSEAKRQFQESALAAAYIPRTQQQAKREQSCTISP